MKIKSILTASLLLAAVSAPAQTMYDALRYSENDYFGTARTMAMGNAFTALGGDLGSIGLNPAGSSVNRFSQVTFTPGFNLLISATRYDGGSESGRSGGWGPGSRKTKTSLPNFGLTTSFNTGNRSGIRNFAFSFTANSTADFLEDFSARGGSDQTSYLGWIADDATQAGVSADLLNDDYWDDGDWLHKVAYQSGMIATTDEDQLNYIGATEKMYKDGSVFTAGPLTQTYRKNAHGKKYDMQVNASMNISDVIYLGVNLGLISLDYSEFSSFKEAAVHPEDFPNEYEHGLRTNFMSAVIRNYYDASGSGFYGKFGIIAVPVSGLRLGAAIQTPALTTITEHWQNAGDTHFSDLKFDGNAVSDHGTYEYRLSAPCRMNFGVAWTGDWGLLSADYELCDYSRMRVEETEITGDSQFDLLNRLNEKFFGLQHLVRTGVEVRLTPQWSLRAGYALRTSPERTWEEDGDEDRIVTPEIYEGMYLDRSLTDSEFERWESSLEDMSYVKACRHAFSLGFGYKSKGSFFCDFAVRAARLPEQFTYPYPDYLSDGVHSPEIRTRSTLWNALATFGWRF